MGKSSLLGSLIGLALAAGMQSDAAGDEGEQLLKMAAKAAEAGRMDEAVKLATQAIEAAPKSVDARVLRARLLASVRRHEEAAADYTAAIALEPKADDLVYWRGRSHFCAGEVAESVADFDKFAAARPKQKPRLWERGISLYYADKFDAGAEQFALYQTYHDNDVENATWRYLCMARSEGVEKARKELLPIKDDRRVPMMQIYAMYRAEMTPEEVLAATEMGEPTKEQLHHRQFYAHLYLGLFYEAAGNEKLARKHIFEAEQRKIAHYMWDVAKVHADRLRKTERKKSPEP